MLYCNCLVENNSCIFFIPNKRWQWNTLKVWILWDSAETASTKYASGMQTIAEPPFIHTLRPVLESHWRHKINDFYFTHCLGDLQALSPLSYLSVWTFQAVMLCTVYLFPCSQCSLFLSLFSFPCFLWLIAHQCVTCQDGRAGSFLHVLIKVSVLNSTYQVSELFRMHLLSRIFENLLLKLFWGNFIFAMCNLYRK